MDQKFDATQSKWSDIYSDTFPFEMIDNVDVKTYYETPILTFEDSLIYGCSLQLTLQELRDFCEKGMASHMMLW